MDDEFPDDADVSEYLNSQKYQEKVSEMVEEIIPPPIRERTRERCGGRDVSDAGDINEVVVVQFKWEENPVKEGEMQLAGRLFNVDISGKHYDKVTLVADRRSRPRPEEGKKYHCRIKRAFRGEDEPIAVFLVEPL